MTTETPARIFDIDDIKSANRVRGLHFFDRDSLRFFKSRIGSDVYQGPGGVFFVTSEQGPHDDSPRRYTVREFHPESGRVEKFGPFNEYTRARAHRIARTVANDRVAGLRAAVEG